MAKARKSGTVVLDRFVLRRLLLERELTVEQFVREYDIHMRTAQKAFRGEPVTMGTATEIRDAFGVKNLLDIVEPSEYTRPDGVGEETAQEQVVRDWVQIERPTAVLTASNGLQYRIHKLRHRYEPSRFGRGKRYELFHLADDEQARLREHLVRHLRVCERLHECPYFPTCLATFPENDGNVWWVIDHWVEGWTLEEKLAEGPLQPDLLGNVMCELARAIAVAHEAGIILRELSPRRVLLRKADSSVLLMDFELAKLNDGSPTVSQSWPGDPYRAPEVEAGTAEVQADFYSWARILVHAASGTLAEVEHDIEQLKTRAATVKIPRSVVNAAVKCMSARPSQRLRQDDQLARALRNWS